MKGGRGRVMQKPLELMRIAQAERDAATQALTTATEELGNLKVRLNTVEGLLAVAEQELQRLRPAENVTEDVAS